MLGAMVGRPHPTHLRRLVTLAAVTSGLPRRIAVEGDSMAPTLLPGDRLLVWPVRRVRPGQVVAVRHDGRLLVKRVAAVGNLGVEVRGDNPTRSTDSRTFGALPRRAVVGQVLYRYAPSDRSGWWPGRLRR
jgi:nickel-type superoxide dismutase maturation protease